MIYTVTVNPCLDEEKSFETDTLSVGTNRAEEAGKHPGGKGIDVSRAIHAHGSRSIATGFIGGHIGQLVKGRLAIEGIKCKFIEIGDETRTNVICKMKNGDEIRINSVGPRITGNNYHDLVNQIQDFDEPQAGLVCGSTCAGMEPIHSYDMILSAFKYKDRSCVTFLDTDDSRRTAAALAGENPPNFIKPNIIEFHRLLRTLDVQGLAPQQTDPAAVGESDLITLYCEPHDSLPSAWEALIKGLTDFALRYRDCGVGILLSVSGLGVLTLEGEYVIHSFFCGEIDKKTTVGAGDSFLGGFVTSYVGQENPHNLEKALQAGVAASTARLQGQHRDFGYINQDKLQEVRASADLRIGRFKINETSKYVENNLLPCFCNGR